MAELLAGACSGFSVTPLNVVVDKSVIEYTSGKGGLWTLARDNLFTIFKAPISFLTGFSFRWMYFVYFFTYTTSNLADHVNLTPDIPHPIQKLLMVFLANTTTSLIKDKKYAVKYGQTVRPFPLASYGLFFTRDIIAMASAFTIPPIFGKEITKRFNVSAANGERIAQLTSPLLIQFIATPIHLLALDLYNRPGITAAERYLHIKNIFSNAIVLRMMRFLPAYGFGGIINIELRKYLKERANE